MVRCQDVKVGVPAHTGRQPDRPSGRRRLEDRGHRALPLQPVHQHNDGGEWSHVGVVVVGESGNPRIFEITGTDHYCTAKPLREELDKALAKKDNVVAFRRLDPGFPVLPP